MDLEVVLGNIVDAKTDAVLNCANNYLSNESGVCGAIFKGAGIKDLEKECNQIGYCETGKAVITKGYKLHSKYIIHAVGLIYYGRQKENELLKEAYINTLMLADNSEIKTLALCSISTGVFGFPLEKAIPIALDVVHNFNPKTLEKCYMYCIDKVTFDCFYKAEQEYRKAKKSIK